MKDTLREKIADTVHKYIDTLVYGKNKINKLSDLTDAILAIPELQEVITKAEWADLIVGENNLLRKQVDRLQEKARMYDEEVDKHTPCPHATLDSCPWCKEIGQNKIKEWKEKAEKAELVQTSLNNYILQLRGQLTKWRENKDA